MARNSGGVYTLPAGNPVVPNTDIESVWANSTLTDIAETLTNSLDVLGRGGMQAELKITDGTLGSLSLRFTNDPDNGAYRLGTNAWALVAGGAAIVALTTSGITVAGSVAVTGTVDGRDVSADGTKLDTIATGAQVNVATDLAQGARSATEVPVTSSTGTGATLTAATALLAGVMVAADKSKLDGIAPGAQVNTVDSVAGKTGVVTLVKADVGLDNVDNTSDATKNSAVATLTNKTVTDLVVDGRVTEEVFAVTGTTPALNPQDGTIQTWTLSANSTPTFAAGFVAGSSMTLMIEDGTAYTITWPVMQWSGGSAPTLATTGYTVVELWRVGAVYYGALVGDMS